MNIKSVGAQPINPSEIRKPDVTKETKTDSSHERDAQAFYGDPNDSQKRKLTQQEIEEAVNHLKSLPFVKDNNWNIRLDQTTEKAIVYVEDHTGKIIRRIPEQDLWGIIAQNQKDQNKGNLLNKAL